MKIKKYESWMRSQVVELFALEYGVDAKEFDTLFGRFYEEQFQATKCVRIVAVEGEKVGGFQSFFYWPTQHHGETKYSLQSGNSLVHPDFRGKGLFAKMLEYINTPEANVHYDFLLGFPVEASYNSFIRNKWLNPFNLQWYILPMNPVLALFTNAENALRKGFAERKQLDFNPDSSTVSVEQSLGFDTYRFGYQTGQYYRFHYTSNKGEAFFEMKIQRRKKVIQELVIGKALFSNTSSSFVGESLLALKKEVKRNANVSMLSIAVNPLVSELVEALGKAGFRPIKRSIYFIVKGPMMEQEQEWKKWWIFRSDIDTW